MICPNCGHEPKEGAAFCTECGFRLDEAAAGASNNSRAENVDDASAQERGDSSPVEDAVSSTDHTANVANSSVSQNVPSTPNVPTGPVATPKKPNGKPTPPHRCRPCRRSRLWHPVCQCSDSFDLSQPMVHWHLVLRWRHHLWYRESALQRRN